MRKNNMLRVLLASVALALLYSSDDKASAYEEDVTDTFARAKWLVQMVASNDKEAHLRVHDILANEHRWLVKGLCPIVAQQGNTEYSVESRRLATCLLTILRDREAVPALSAALADNLMPESTTGVDFAYHTPVGALIAIGRPAVPEMIKNIRTSDDELVVERSARVLRRVLGGKRRTIELIDKLAARETDDQVKKRLANARKIAEAWEEKEEPLY